MKKTQIEKMIRSAIKEATEKSYKKGAIEAMSVAVNAFNCEPEIRRNVFLTMFKTENP